MTSHCGAVTEEIIILHHNACEDLRPTEYDIGRVACRRRAKTTVTAVDSPKLTMPLAADACAGRPPRSIDSAGRVVCTDTSGRLQAYRSRLRSTTSEWADSISVRVVTRVRAARDSARISMNHTAQAMVLKDIFETGPDCAADSKTQGVSIVLHLGACTADRPRLFTTVTR